MGPVPSEQNFNFYPSKPSSMQKDPIPNWHTEFPLKPTAKTKFPTTNWPILKISYAIGTSPMLQKRSKFLNPTHLQPLDSLLERGRPRLHNGLLLLLLLLLLLGHLHSGIDLNRAGASVGTICVTEPSSGQRACRGQGAPSQSPAAVAAASHCNRGNAAPPAQRQGRSGVS